MLALIVPGTLLVVAFAVGIWTSAGSKRTAARITAAMLLGYTATGTAAQVFFRRFHVRPWQRARERCATPCTSL